MNVLSLRKTILCLVILFTSVAVRAHDKIFEENGITIKDVSALKTLYVKVEQLYSFNAEFETVKAKGVILKVAKGAGYGSLDQVRQVLKDTNSQAYLYDNHFGYSEDEIAIVPTKSDIEYLKIIRTDGANYEYSAEYILEKYQMFDEKYQLRLIGAGTDWIEAKVEAKNVNWKELANIVYQLAPDVVEQGAGTVEELEKEMRSTKTIYLWWD